MIGRVAVFAASPCSCRMRRTHAEKSSDRFISSQGQEGKEWNFNVDWIGVVDSVFFVLRGKEEKPVGKRGREHERKRGRGGRGVGGAKSSSKKCAGRSRYSFQTCLRWERETSLCIPLISFGKHYFVRRDRGAERSISPERKSPSPPYLFFLKTIKPLPPLSAHRRLQRKKEVKKVRGRMARWRGSEERRASNHPS